MDCKKQDQVLQQMCSQRLANEKDPVERIKASALKNGCCGIKSIGRKFRIMDDSSDRRLSKDEFIVGCRECRLSKLSPEEIGKAFDVFDKDNSGYLDYEEFLSAVRPAMSECRTRLVMRAFDVLDTSGDGVVTIDDLSKYKVKSHPKYLNGEMTREQVLLEFLKNFEADADPDGKVTKAEWLDYYSGVSASIDDDAYFSLMMHNAWKFDD